MKIKKTVGAGVASLGLVIGLGGFAAAATGSITNTGPDSQNTVKSKTVNKARVRNNNHLNLTSTTSQSATSGDARTNHNGTGGDATTGAASNTHELTVDATIDNSATTGGLGGAVGSGDDSGTITGTGPDSTNVVKSKTINKLNVQNNNNLTITNSTSQTATSGDAHVNDNTTGGSATSGDVSNSSTTGVTIDLTN
jgi:hypothetical protein